MQVVQKTNLLSQVLTICQDIYSDSRISKKSKKIISQLVKNKRRWVGKKSKLRMYRKWSPQETQTTRPHQINKDFSA